MRKLFDYSQPLVAAATIITFGILVAVAFGGYLARQVILSRNTIEVTGSAKEAVKADTARWTISLSTKTGINDQSKGYARLETATKKITDYLATQGVTDAESNAITTSQEYEYPQGSSPVFIGYNVSRQITVHSTDIEKMSTLANTIAPLTGDGYQVTSQSLELTYSKLDEVRVRLLAAAVQDAKARAESIVKDSGEKVGSLRHAASGVVQVLPQGGIDVSDYGSYDTQSKNKDIMVTVRATFGL